MALKQLRLNKQLEQKRGKLSEINEKMEGISLREAEIEAALEEATSDEDMTLVDEQIDTLLAEKNDAEKEPASSTTASHISIQTPSGFAPSSVTVASPESFTTSTSEY
ncbi:hypothetical protein LJB89_02810, partial [Tyzzerella sp. OttesenSCG-928-J15]|nr:hypothetical protein [Tyzzerella sp. OttesenSCG-928-J15]